MPPKPRDWSAMREQMEAQLLARTGEDVAAWNRKVAEVEPTEEPALRAWLAEQGVTGYPQMLLVMERFGYPGFMLADADELINGQYGDRPQLRPILDALMALAPALGEDVDVQARKGYVTLVTPRRQFAVVRATTRSRVDLGLRLAGLAPGGRLLDAKGLGNDTINVRIALESVEDVDDEVVDLVRRACEASR